MKSLILLCVLVAQICCESVQRGAEMTLEKFQQLEQENKQLQAMVAGLQAQMNDTKKNTVEMIETLNSKESKIREQEFEQMKEQLAQLMQIVLNGGDKSTKTQDNLAVDVEGTNVLVSSYAASALQTLAKTTVLGGRTYLFVTKQTANWFEANTYCGLLGMALLSIETEAENTLIMTQLNKLGMTKDWVMTGGNKIGWPNYTWMTGVAVDFEDWARGQPEQFNSEHCLILWRGDWYDLPCDSIRIKFICEQVD